MEIFVQQLINGITLGSIYGLIAIGYTMVFGIIGMVNFAHGDVFMVSAFIALITFLVLTSWLGIGSIILALLIVLIIATMSTITSASAMLGIPIQTVRIRKTISATKDDTMNTSPWAKLTMPMMPNTIV